MRSYDATINRPHERKVVCSCRWELAQQDKLRVMVNGGQHLFFLYECWMEFFFFFFFFFFFGEKIPTKVIIDGFEKKYVTG